MTSKVEEFIARGKTIEKFFLTIKEVVFKFCTPETKNEFNDAVTALNSLKIEVAISNKLKRELEMVMSENKTLKNRIDDLKLKIVTMEEEFKQELKEKITIIKELKKLTNDLPY